MIVDRNLYVVLLRKLLHDIHDGAQFLHLVVCLRLSHEHRNSHPLGTVKYLATLSLVQHRLHNSHVHKRG